MNHRVIPISSIHLALGVLFLLGGLMTSSRAYADSAYTLVPVQYGMELKTPDGRVVFRYMTTKPEDIGLTSPSVACFHPVFTPKGEMISNIAPNDHPHHRGMFFGFMNSEFHSPDAYPPNAPPTHWLKAYTVHRADYWAWGVYAPREGRVIQNHSVKLTSGDSKHAQIEIQNDWTIADNGNNFKNYLHETDEVFVTERDGVYVIDTYYRLAPLVDYEILPTAFGGFAFQAQKYGDSYYSSAAGKVELRDPHYSYPDSDWPSEPWYDFTIKLQSDGKTAGVAVVDHPLNPPTRWHNARYLWMLNPCISTFGPFTIHPDQPLILRYRVVVHDGPPPTALIQQLSDEWRATDSNPFPNQAAQSAGN